MDRKGLRKPEPIPDHLRKSVRQTKKLLFKQSLAGVISRTEAVKGELHHLKLKIPYND